MCLRTTMSDEQSASMGSIDDDVDEETMIPMKNPAITNDGDDPDSFLDDDFLSFANHNNGGQQFDRPDPFSLDDRYSAPGAEKPAIIPWMTNAVTIPEHQSSNRQQQQKYDRGYGNIAYNNNSQRRIPSMIRLHNEIVSFVNLMSPTVDEMKLREKVVERVTKLAQATFRGEDVKVLPFGSQVTGLCLPGSDIDFVIRLPSRDPADISKDNPLHRFADAVLNEFGTRSELLEGGAHDDEYDGKKDDHQGKEYLSYLEIIEQTRVPLVKFTIAPYDIDVDVCFNQPHGPESAELMFRFMESMPPLRPMTIVLKYFLASRDINKPFTGGIGSYLLQLMIVSYLQHRAREDVAKRHGASGKHYNLGSLLLDFLELYGMDFNYVTTGISVRHDGYYFPKGLSDRRESFWQPTRPFSLAMENPLDPTADVGAGAFRMQMIQRIFGHAFKTLLAYVSEPSVETESILARIIPPTEEMERRMIAKGRCDDAMRHTVDYDDGEGVGDERGDDSKKRKSSQKKRRRDDHGRQGGGGGIKKSRHST